MHVVIGELVPKTISLARAERVALLIAVPFHWFLKTFRWAIYLLEAVSNGIIQALGVTTPQGHGVAHSTEELQIQIQQARERGLLAAGEEKFIVSAIELTQVQVREIMVPRPDMHTLPSRILARRRDARIRHHPAIANPRLSGLAKITFSALYILRICCGCCSIANAAPPRISRRPHSICAASFAKY